MTPWEQVVKAPRTGARGASRNRAKSRPLASAAPASQSLTESGVVLGTLAYMAPEQLSGKEVDHRTDLYAAGVILVEMLTGHRPFEDGADPPADRYPALDAALKRCLAKQPEDRFPSALELGGALIPALRACGAGGAPHADGLASSH